eukprot:gene13007-13136_t
MADDMADDIPVEVQLQHPSAAESATHRPSSSTRIGHNSSGRALAVSTKGRLTDGGVEPADADQACLGFDMIDDFVQQHQQRQHRQEEEESAEQQYQHVEWFKDFEQLQQPATAKERHSDKLNDLALQPGRGGRLQLLAGNLSEAEDADRAAAVTSGQWQAIDPAELGVVLGPPPVLRDEPVVLLPSTAGHASGDQTFF